MKRKPFVCQECFDVVRAPVDRIVVSEDHMREDGSLRLHRIKLMDLCKTCSDKRERSLRPTGPESHALFPS